MTMFPSACIWPFKTSITSALIEIKQTAFHYVDIETETLDAPGVPEALKELGLKVSCVALDHRLTTGGYLEGNDQAGLRKAVDYLKKGLARAQTVGAQAASIAPCLNRKGLQGFSTALKEISEDAAQRGIRVCVEHVHGRALSTAKEALSFVQGTGQPNLHLLLDTGCALISKEKPWEIVVAAGKKIGHVRLHDNNGRSNKHWAPLDGRTTETDLAKLLDALKQTGYEGTLGLELHDDRASIICGLSKSRNLLLRMQQTSECKSLKEPESRRKQ